MADAGRGPLLALISMLAGCTTGWRAGVGLSADTTASIGGQIFVGGHFGFKTADESSLEFGVEGETSLRSTPVRVGAGVDERVDYRHESRDKLPGWMLGIYAGVRGLFLNGLNGESRAGLAFNLLPVLSQDGDTWRHIGGELQAGFSGLFSAPDTVQPPLVGELALRVFYEIASLHEGRPL